MTGGYIVAFPNELPQDYLDFAESEKNGCLFYHGYYRLLGSASPPPYCLQSWNERECWRFAWSDSRLKPSYYIIGFSAWGDQYAIDLNSPSEGVLELDAHELVPTPVGHSFSDFFTKEVVAVDLTPYDSKTKIAFAQFGPLSWPDSIALVPPLLLASNEDDCTFSKSNMRAMMIQYGDLCSQLDALGEGEVRRIDPYTDEKGRLRLRVVTS